VGPAPRAAFAAVKLVRRRAPQPLLVLVLRAGAGEEEGHLVMVVDPAQPRAGIEPLLRAWFGLTQREAELTALLGGALSLEEAAAMLGMSSGTARAHLRHVFAKCGARSQAELVARVVGWLPPVDLARAAALAAASLSTATAVAAA
jgi:DNA-binding CsgD family transcriptional regulator